MEPGLAQQPMKAVYYNSKYVTRSVRVRSAATDAISPAAVAHANASGLVTAASLLFVKQRINNIIYTICRVTCLYEKTKNS